MPTIYSNIHIKSMINVLDTDSLKKLKLASNFKEFAFDINYKTNNLNSSNYFIRIACNESKYSDVIAGTPYFEIIKNLVRFEFKGTLKLSLKPELIELLLNDKNPKLHFSRISIYIPEYENLVHLDLQDNDDYEISISFQKTKPKI
jgi:hypothetical protein